MAAAQLAALPDVTGPRTSSARRTASAPTPSTTTSAATPGSPWPGAELADRGVGLVLDFVPNHVSPDHPWAVEHPEYFVRGTADDLAADPDSFLAVGDAVIARGRDPYFPAWPEVLQLDASAPVLRAAAAGVVGSIADRCDGVRCDMAMLMLDDIFVRTWGERAERRAVAGRRSGLLADGDGRRAGDHPDFVFWAEAYWDLEPVLVEQGFDACYDKRLYDRLVGPRAGVVGAGPPRRRSRLPGPHRAVRGEPRRAAAGGHAARRRRPGLRPSSR